MIQVTVLALLAIVQSVFGVGLLVFGTPTLLLLGYSFSETLATLLPASLAVSILQMVRSGAPPAPFARRFVGWCIGPIAVTLAIVLTTKLHTSLDLAVATLLIVFVALRMAPRIGESAKQWVTSHERFWLVLMGVVHGLSNLGGALLLLFAASRSRDKTEIRATVAFCYSCFATIQLIVLAWFAPDAMSVAQISYAAIGGAVFLAFGQRVFKRLSAPAFDKALTLCAAGYAVLLALRGFGFL